MTHQSRDPQGVPMSLRPTQEDEKPRLFDGAAN